MINPSPFLRRAIQADALVSGAMALLLVVVAGFLARPWAGASHRRVLPGRRLPSPRGRAARAHQFGDGQNAAGGVGVVFSVDRGVSRGWPDYRSSR